jgi:hypothetical protein
MKRRITIDNIKELTPDRWVKLREWWKPEVGDMYITEIANGVYIWTGTPNDYDDDKKIPLLDISQMIEILEYKNCDIYFNQDCTIPLCSLKVDGRRYMYREICDALWEAVKQVI